MKLWKASLLLLGACLQISEAEQISTSSCTTCSSYGICSYKHPNADVVVKHSTCESCNVSCAKDKKCQFAYFAPRTSKCYLWYSAFDESQVEDCYNKGSGPYFRVGCASPPPVCSPKISSKSTSSHISSTSSSASGSCLVDSCLAAVQTAASKAQDCGAFYSALVSTSTQSASAVTSTIYTTVVGTVAPTVTSDVVYTSTIDVDATAIVSTVVVESISYTSTLTTMVYPPTVTVTTTTVSAGVYPTPSNLTIRPKKRNASSALPSYAGACANAANFVSACMCAGVSAPSSYTVVTASPSTLVVISTIWASTTASTAVVYETISSVVDYETVSTVYTTAVSTSDVSVLASTEIDTTIEPTPTVTTTLVSVSYPPNPTFSVMINYPPSSQQAPQALGEDGSLLQDGEVPAIRTTNSGYLFSLDQATGSLKIVEGYGVGYKALYYRNNIPQVVTFYSSGQSFSYDLVCQIEGSVNLTCTSIFGNANFYATPQSSTNNEVIMTFGTVQGSGSGFVQVQLTVSYV